jgi:O-antigen ligase
MIACILAIFLTQIWRDKGKCKLFAPALPIMMLVFILYIFFSALWARSSSDTIIVTKTLFEILLMIYILYGCYSDNPHCVDDILGCIKWGSYIISLYSFYYYGIDFLIKASLTGDRLDNAYANVNTIGMLAAIGIVIQIDNCLRTKKIGSSFLCIPSIILIALTQSRKALLVLVIGGILCVVFHNTDTKNILKSAGKLLVLIPLVLVVLHGVMSLPIFSGLMERMDSWIAGATGAGHFDSSSLLRNQMIEIGLHQFLDTPVFGIGMANAHLVSLEHLGLDAYLHNNYVELLVGGGIIGFLLYYSMYAYVLAVLVKYRNNKNSEYVICLVMLIILLMLDFGMVSYYSKIRYIYLLVLFLEVKKLKTKTGLQK